MSISRWYIVAALWLPLLTACQSAPLDEPDSGFSFEGHDSRFALRSECAENVELRPDINGKPYVIFDMVETPECFGKFDSWIHGQVGKKISLQLDGEPVTRPLKVFSPVGPNHIRIITDSQAMLLRVFTYLSQ
ncbi:hypothetical protein [Halomonas sp. WWR20]